MITSFHVVGGKLHFPIGTHSSSSHMSARKHLFYNEVLGKEKSFTFNVCFPYGCFKTTSEALRSAQTPLHLVESSARCHLQKHKDSCKARAVKHQGCDTEKASGQPSLRLCVSAAAKGCRQPSSDLHFFCNTRRCSG